MNKTDYIKELIQATGLSMKAFAKHCDIPYTTLRSMLERGIENASVNNVIKVCSKLKICIEELYGQDCNDINLRTDEEKILDNYNKLNDLGKKEANKRVLELTQINLYTYDENMQFAAHSDGLTEEENKIALKRALEALEEDK